MIKVLTLCFRPHSCGVCVYAYFADPWRRCGFPAAVYRMHGFAAVTPWLAILHIAW